MPDSQTLLCLSPEIGQEFLILEQRTKRDTDVSVEFLISFHLDGVETYNETNVEENLSDYAKLKVVVKAPVAKDWGEVLTHKAGESITIYGEEVC